MKTTCWVVMRGFGKLFGSSLQSKSIRDENSSGPSKNSSLSFSQFWEYSSSKASYVITMNYKRKLCQLIKLINYVVCCVKVMAIYIRFIYCLNCNKSTQSYTVVVFYGF